MADYLMDTNHLSPLVTLGHPLWRRFFETQQTPLEQPHCHHSAPKSNLLE
jgi:hypothetical protein